MKKIFLTALLLYGGHAAAQIQTDTVTVYYRVEKSKIDTTFLGNGATINNFLDRLRTVTADKRNQNFNFHINSYASLEGPLALNEHLYEARTNEFLKYIREHGIQLPGDVNVLQDNCYNWEELKRRVEQSDIPYKDEVLNVIRNTPEWSYGKNGQRREYRKQKLMALRGGVPFRYMKRHFFPEMRYSAFRLNYLFVEPTAFQPLPPKVEDDTVLAIKWDLPHLECLQMPATRKPFYMALKTNMLLDVLAIPNIGIEFYLGNNWSLSGNAMYGWWKSDKRHRYWRLYGGEVAVRKWFGSKAMEKPLTGHHLGLYGQLFTYDFEWGGKGYIGGKPGGTLWESPNYAFGVEYGYALPIARRLNIDFVLGVGYWGGKYHTYNPRDGHYVWQSTRQRHWFGPTKAEISLVWLLGRGNTNKKGGK